MIWPLLALAFAMSSSKKAAAAVAPSLARLPAPGGPFPPQVTKWAAPLAGLPQASKYPMGFLLAWILIESGGFPNVSTADAYRKKYKKEPPPDFNDERGLFEVSKNEALGPMHLSPERFINLTSADGQALSDMLDYVGYLNGLAKAKLDAAGVKWSQAAELALTKIEHAGVGYARWFWNAGGNAPNWETFKARVLAKIPTLPGEARQAQARRILLKSEWAGQVGKNLVV